MYCPVSQRGGRVLWIICPPIRDHDVLYVSCNCDDYCLPSIYIYFTEGIMVVPSIVPGGAGAKEY